jgi:hypothetical protein
MLEKWDVRILIWKKFLHTNNPVDYLEIKAGNKFPHHEYGEWYLMSIVFIEKENDQWVSIRFD